MTIHAFVDENKVRGFLLVAALVKAGDLAGCRSAMQNLLLPGQRRIHFTKESSSRQRLVRDVVRRLPVEAWMYQAPRSMPEREARALALDALVRDLATVGAHRMVIEQDESVARHDKEVIYQSVRSAGSADHLVYEHLLPHQEPLLWIPDAIAWCWAKAGPWRRSVAALVPRVTEL
ncbi:MAG: hypothetical protein NTV23_02720 [Propionibacteriales bacterium]|nr:hypothetical protein [Propionibacteriales bacterium]